MALVRKAEPAMTYPIYVFLIASLILNLADSHAAETIYHPVGCDIKGNINGKKRLYYLPNHPLFEKVLVNGTGEKWFCDEDEAIKGGWKPAGTLDGRLGKTMPTSTCEIPDDAPSKDCAIKGNINGDGERIVHTPCSKYYAKTEIRTEDGERWFCSLEEAISAGWRKPRN